MTRHANLVLLGLTISLLLLHTSLGGSTTSSTAQAPSSPHDYPADQEALWAWLQDKVQRLEALEALNDQLTRHVLQQQLSMEEKTRSAGDSGIKAERTEVDGPKAYYARSFSIGHLHNHNEFPRTLGMGELHPVLNGVDFRTRHNDYSLFMPSTSSSDYNAVEDVPFPEVPPPVTAMDSVDEQIAEMREWFKAWRDSDFSVRDYRPYFKPVLCYLEGAWTTEPQSELTEPFYSTRHALDATSWDDLHQKARFESGTGIKYDSENMAFLPVKFFNGTDGQLFLAQWNYRILCHPIQAPLGVDNLKPVEDLGARLSLRKTFEDFQDTRGVRFRVSGQDEEDFYESGSLLDRIMQEVPGQDNYPANITDHFHGVTKYDFLSSEPLNVGYYHLWYREGDTDKSNRIVRRGFHDRNLFVAETTRQEVAPLTVELCEVRPRSGKTVCQVTEKRVSYAIPLEIVFLTPLQAWNPYNIVYKGNASSLQGQTVEADGRNGKPNPDEALNGTNSNRYFHTPAHLFTGGDVTTDVSGTIDGVLGVLDGDGEVRQVLASGLQVFLPNMVDVGVLRTRYPVFPLYDEGSNAWKQMQALQDVLLDLEGYQDYLRSVPSAFNQSFVRLVTTPPKTLLTSYALDPNSGYHHHVVNLSPRQYIDLVENKKTLVVRSQPDSEHTHSHELEFRYFKGEYKILSCDGGWRCEHDHGKLLHESNDADPVAK